MLLVVIEDSLDGLHARIVIACVILSCALLVPIQDLNWGAQYIQMGTHMHSSTYAANERRHQGYTGLGTRNGLNESKHEGQVAVDTVLLFKLASGLDSLPRRGDLDEDPVSVDANRLIQSNQFSSLCNAMSRRAVR